MLGEHPVGVVLLTQDMAASRRFYAEALGLEVAEESEAAITYRSAGTELTVTTSTVGSKDEQTKASWKVQDLRAELDQLKARGVSPEDYDTDELKTVDGIADHAGMWSAWITDPDGNSLGIEQPK
jgi:catechol 2,3-dioxygenase-like lactoylglutathione lyase family enzyme